jgi:hypothetical protein
MAKRAKIELTEKDMQRFWSKVSLPITADGCMIWRAGKSTAGYGRFYLFKVPGEYSGGYKRIYTFAHRVAYTIMNGPIPDELEIDHTCGNRPCVRPDHLEAVTQAENMERSLHGSRKDFCKNGHEFNEKNTYIHVNKYSGQVTRNCRICNNAARKRRRLAGKI